MALTKDLKFPGTAVTSKAEAYYMVKTWLVEIFDKRVVVVLCAFADDTCADIIAPCETYELSTADFSSVGEIDLASIESVLIDSHGFTQYV